MTAHIAMPFVIPLRSNKNRNQVPMRICPLLASFVWSGDKGDDKWENILGKIKRPQYVQSGYIERYICNGKPNRSERSFSWRG